MSILHRLRRRASDWLRERQQGTISVSWGSSGGFYLHRHRVCLGRVAATVIPGVEIDELMEAYVERSEHSDNGLRQLTAERRFDVTDALSVLDRMVTDTAAAANRAAVNADGQFDVIGAGAGVGVRLAAFNEARAAIVAAALAAHEQAG